MITKKEKVGIKIQKNPKVFDENERIKKHVCGKND